MKKPFNHSISHPIAGRRQTGLALIAFFTSGLGACQPTSSDPNKGKTMNRDGKEVVYFDVNLKSYLDRPIFDVYLNGVDIGVAGGPPHGGNGGLMTGVAVPLGPQKITWRLDGPEGMKGNGETVTAVNPPVLTLPDKNLTYLGVHIYPDNTVELIPEAFWPQASARGDAINREWEKKHGQ